MANLTQFRWNPKTGSAEQVIPASERAPVPRRYVGGSMPDGSPAPHVGGDTWEMNAMGQNAMGQDEFFAGPQKWQAEFDPFGQFDRIGNAKDANGNVIMAQPAPNSAPNMGTLGQFDFWNSTRQGYTGTQGRSGASKPAAPPTDPIGKMSPSWMAGAVPTPSDISRRLRESLGKGDFLGYLNQMLLGKLGF